MRHGDGNPELERAAIAAAGFTLLELLVVCGVLAVLLGLSVGMLGRTDPQAVADSVLAGELRSAQLTARAEGLPTEVLVRPGQDGAQATVQTRLLQPVATFHFEPREGVLDEVLRPTYGGDDVPQGRFGHARRNRAGDKAPVARWAVRPEAGDLREGVVFRLDLWLDDRAAATVLRCGGMVEAQLDSEGRLRARWKLQGGTTSATPVAALQAKTVLPLRRWVTVDVACDGRSAWLSVDGHEVDRAIADGRPLHEPEDVLDVSPGDAAVPGMIDEVRVFAYVFGSSQDLPSPLQPDHPYRIGFDSRGEPSTSTAVKLVMPEEHP